MAGFSEFSPEMCWTAIPEEIFMKAGFTSNKPTHYFLDYSDLQGGWQRMEYFLPYVFHVKHTQEDGGQLYTKLLLKILPQNPPYTSDNTS